jgi:alpha-L-fucosidase
MKWILKQIACMILCGVAGLGAASAAEGARLPRPSRAQAAWQDMEIGMFIHWVPEMWQHDTSADTATLLQQIDPSKVDTEQWVEAATAMGARYIVFVARHGDGFCWWPTATTDYSIAHLAWRGGKGDIMRDLSESCRKRGLKLGVYLCPVDQHKVGYVNEGGRCKSPEEQRAYDKYYRAQLTELLSRYGKISEVWFDGGLQIEVGDILRKYARDAMIFQGKYATIRWVGNEDGFAPDPAWNAVSEDAALTGGSTAKDGDPNGSVWLPLECDARIRREWGWVPGPENALKTVDQLMDMYYRSVGQGAVLLLNQAPEPSGQITATDAQRAAEFGAEIQRRFGRSLAEATGSGDIVELSLDRPTTIDHVITMEDIAQGERVREYAIERWNAGQWEEICHGSSIGHKKIDRFRPVEVTRVRFRCLSSSAPPKIRRLALFHAGPGPN